MKKLVFFPSDPIKAYLDKGRTFDFLDNYYNPGGYFDEVYCLSPWGEAERETIGKICYIKASPLKFAQIIKKIKPDVIRGYGGYCCADWVSINKVQGIPTVVSVHDTNTDLIHDSLSFADAIICMSQAVKEAVITKVPNVTSNVWVMPNRIDTDLYRKRFDEAYFNILNDRFPGKYHVLHVGRKSEQKNLDTVIQAMKYLDEDIVTIFVGQGDITLYKELAIQEGVEKRCFFVDRVPSDELSLWYSWCDCMCTPSRWEGFGYVFVEAAACETAVITSDIGPMNEYLIDGENAILVKDYEKPRKIADAILYALSNDDSIQKIRKNARKVGLLFEKDAIDKQEIKIYEKVMSINPNNKNFCALKRRLKREEFFANHNTLICISKHLNFDKVYHYFKKKK